MPLVPNDGPMARMMTFFVVLPIDDKAADHHVVSGADDAARGDLQDLGVAGRRRRVRRRAIERNGARNVVGLESVKFAEKRVHDRIDRLTVFVGMIKPKNMPEFMERDAVQIKTDHIVRIG